MQIKKSVSELIFDFANIIFMCFLCIITAYPFYFVFVASFSDPYKLMGQMGILLHPVGFSFMPYQLVFKNALILSGYKNTFMFLIVGTAISLFLTSIAAYVLSRKRLFWKKLLMTMIVVTMFISGGLIPLFLVILKFHLINTMWAVILPDAMAATYVIMMRTYFQGIPVALEESAKIDGANDITVLFRIILPLSMPVLAVMALFYGVGYWNSWFYAAVFLRKSSMFPIQLVMRDILITNTDTTISVSMDDPTYIYRETIKYAAVIISTGPILIAYPFLQKYFVKGIMVGSLKG
jgi:putative aldouronate transport system permease protein